MLFVRDKEHPAVFVLRNDYEVGRWSWKSLLSRMQELRPSDFDSLVSIAEMYFSEELYEDAAGLFTSALEVRPGDPRALVGLGKTYNAQGRFQDAIEKCRQALDAEPLDPNIRLPLAACYLADGMSKEALSEARTAQEMDPDNETARKLSALALSMEGDHQMLIDVFGDILERETRVAAE